MITIEELFEKRSTNNHTRTQKYDDIYDGKKIFNLVVLSTGSGNYDDRATMNFYNERKCTSIALTMRDGGGVYEKYMKNKHNNMHNYR